MSRAGSAFAIVVRVTQRVRTTPVNDTEGVGETVRMIDSTVIRAHHCAVDARGAPEQGLGRSGGGFSTKIHLRTTGAGLTVAVHIASRQASDCTDALPLFNAGGPEPEVLLADRGCDADAVWTAVEARGVAPVIPKPRSRKVRIPTDDHVWALRNRNERCFDRLKNLCRLAKRYDKTADVYLGFVLIAAVRLSTRAFVNRT